MNTPQDLLLHPGPMRTINVPLPDKELTIKELLNLLLRRRFTVLGTLAFFVAIALLICVFTTRRYLAIAEIQVQKESSSQLGLESSTGDESGYSDALQDSISLQTQANILQSDSLALKVIKDLNLAQSEDFKPTFNPLGWALGFLSPKGPSDAQLGPAGESDLGLSPRERMHVLGVFSLNLKVKPVSGTRLIDVSYLSSNPRQAAEVVNALTQGLSDYNFETRHAATAKTAQYLATQLTDLRKQSEELQAQVARAQRDSGIVSLGGVDAQGREQIYSAVLDKLQQATTAYGQAQSNRIAKDAVYQAAKTGDPEAISSLSGSAAFATSDSGLGLIQSLRIQQTTLKSQLAQTSAKFGPAFPRVAEMQQQLDSLDTSIQNEVSRLADRAKNDSNVARGVEENTRHVYLDLKTQADVLNNKTINYTIMRQEADQSRVLYETLFKQLKQAGVLADFHVSNISIVDPARVPARPAKPNVLLYLLGSVAGGLFFGCCGALVLDLLDNKISNFSDLELLLGQLPLGVLPYHYQKRNVRRPVRAQIRPLIPEPRAISSQPVGQLSSIEHTRLAALNDPRSAYIESLRALRTSILLSRGGSPPQIILVTSSVASEGKSMLSSNLAAVLAQQGKRVLLVDADFRRPTLHRTLNIANSEGLSSFLAGTSTTIDPMMIGIASEEVPGLTVLTAGPVPPYPTELLGSDQMHKTILTWREHFDFIVLDGAPVLPVTDSVVLSSMVDFTLLLARHEVTERQSLERSFRLLQGQTERTHIGIVLNAVKRDSSTYYQYYGYKDSVYYGSSKKYAQ